MHQDSDEATNLKAGFVQHRPTDGQISMEASCEIPMVLRFTLQHSECNAAKDRKQTKTETAKRHEITYGEWV